MGQDLVFAGDGLPVKAQGLATGKTDGHEKAERADYYPPELSSTTVFNSCKERVHFTILDCRS
jgi:hypothetical protein